MSTRFLRYVLPSVALTVGAYTSAVQGDTHAAPTGPQVHYLEIVTKEVDATCENYETVHGVTFGDPVPHLGNARTAPLAGGGTIGVRGPLRPDEESGVHPYLLVDDIKSATKKATDQGAELAIPAMEVPGQGSFAIYLIDGVWHGLWEHKAK